MRRHRVWLAALALLLASACNGGGSEAATSDDEPERTGPRRFTVAAGRVTEPFTEYGFKVETPLPAEKLEFVLTNIGDEKHEMVLFRLKEGVDLTQDLVTSENRNKFAAEKLGRIPPVPPEETDTLTATVTEDNTYAIVCYLRGPGDKTHAARGQWATFEVVPGSEIPYLE